MASSTEPSGRRIFWMMALFVVLGIPFVAVIWESLNHILALEFSARVWMLVPAALVLAGVLYLLARTLRRSTAD